MCTHVSVYTIHVLYMYMYVYMLGVCTFVCSSLVT